MGRRVSRLERATATATADAGSFPGVVLVWPEDETPETRAHNAQAAAWVKAHGWPETVRLVWPDGSEVKGP